MAGMKPYRAHAASSSRRIAVDYEGNEQVALLRWLQLQHPAAYALTYHVPNGGRRDKVTAAKLKAQGVKAGIPDLKMAIARGGFFGLYIEFKATPPHDAAVSPSQREMLALLADQGYRAIVCRGMAEAMAAIIKYLNLPPTLSGAVVGQ
nr:VRR-NUC domain-containing protein [uncultured Pseudomonas sp.]